MKAIIKPQIWKILFIFYESKNREIHLRELARATKMNENSISRYLNSLEKSGILVSKKDGNLKKYKVRREKIPAIFQMYDEDKLESLPLDRRAALAEYLKKSREKVLFAIVFGSTARGNFTEESDIDILEIVSEKRGSDEIKRHVEAQTAIKIQIFQASFRDFKNEIKSREDKVLASAIETGFCIFNAKYFYEVAYE